MMILICPKRVITGNESSKSSRWPAQQIRSNLKVLHIGHMEVLPQGFTILSIILREYGKTPRILLIIIFQLLTIAHYIHRICPLCIFLILKTDEN